MRVALVATPFATCRMPPLSLALLAACLKRDGHTVACFDMNLELFRRSGRRDLFRYAEGWRWKDRAAYGEMMREAFEPYLPRLLYELHLYNPEFVGVSAWNAPFTELVAGSVKARSRRVPVVAGGPLAQRALGRLALRPSPNLDAVVSGEGELVLPALVRRFEHAGTLFPMPGVTVHDDGAELDGGDAYPVEDPDGLPDADFSEFDLAGYDDADFGGGVAFPLLHSRGCPCGCAFCADAPLWGRPVRARSPGRTAAEVFNHVERFGARRFVFLDLCVNPSAAILDGLAEALAGTPADADFCAMVRFTADLADEARLDRLRDARFVHLTFGLESGSDATLERMGKPFDARLAARTLDLLDRRGILASVNLIAGFPGETEAEVDASIAFVRENAARIWSAPSVAVCAAPPASALARDPSRFGIRLDPRDPEAHETWTGDDGSTRELREARAGRMREAFAAMRFRRDPG